MDQLLDFFEKHLFESASEGIYDAKDHDNSKDGGQDKQDGIKEKINHKAPHRDQCQNDKCPEASAECLPIKYMFHKATSIINCPTPNCTECRFNICRENKSFCNKKTTGTKELLPNYTGELSVSVAKEK